MNRRKLLNAFFSGFLSKGRKKTISCFEELNFNQNSQSRIIVSFLLLFFADKIAEMFFWRKPAIPIWFFKSLKKVADSIRYDQAFFILCVTFRARDFHRFDGNRERACRIQMRVSVLFREPDSRRLSFFNSRRPGRSCFVVHHELDNWRVGRLSSSGGAFWIIWRMKFAFLVFLFWKRIRRRSSLPNCHSGSRFFFRRWKEVLFIRRRHLQPFYFTRRLYGFAWNRHSKSSFAFFETVLDFWIWQFQIRVL